MIGEKNPFSIAILLILLILLTGGAVHASDIYRWVDEDGVTHFSDSPPDDGSAAIAWNVSTSNPPDYDPAADPYSIVNQAKRMKEKWSVLAEEKEKRVERRHVETNSRTLTAYYPWHYDGWQYGHRPGYSAPAFSARPPSSPFRTVRRQANALDSLSLTGPRPYSINSSAHYRRVQSSKNFLQSISRPALPRD